MSECHVTWSESSKKESPQLNTHAPEGACCGRTAPSIFSGENRDTYISLIIVGFPASKANWAGAFYKVEACHRRMRESRLDVLDILELFCASGPVDTAEHLQVSFSGMHPLPNVMCGREGCIVNMVSL